MMQLTLLIILIVIEVVISKHLIVVGDKENWEIHSSGDKFEECTDDDATTGWASNEEYGNEIGVQCCLQDGSDGCRESCLGGCLQGVTYDIAKAACDGIGYRLCTAQEVRDNIGGGSGCNHDARHVWTADECAAHSIVIGKQANIDIDNKPDECADDDAITGIGYSTSYGNDIAVQCCTQDGTSGSRESNGVCLEGVTYSVAKTECINRGYRLCTAQEVRNDVGAGSGCSHDHRHVWTSDLCDNTAHEIVVGKQDNIGDKPDECAVNTAIEGVASNDDGNEIGVQCCTMDGSDGLREDLEGGEDYDSYTGCLKGVSYDEAKRACRAKEGGYRLCSAQEVTNHIGQGTGCSHDSRHVWTADTCQYTAHEIVIGKQSNIDDKPDECADNDATTGSTTNAYGNEIGVQCCKLDGSDGCREDCIGGCLQGVTYDVAKAACNSAEGGEYRLCTAQEVRNNVGGGTGCSHDQRHVWTADSCIKPPTLSPTSSPSTASPTSAPTPIDVSLPSNNHDLFCGANNDKPTWTAILSLDQDTLNLLQNVKSEDGVKKIMEYVMCSEFIYHIVGKSAVPGPIYALQLTNALLLLLQEIPAIGDVVGDTANDVSQFIVDLMDTLTPDETGISWQDYYDPDGTIYNPFQRLEVLGEFLSIKICNAIVGEGNNLNQILQDLRDSAAITAIKDAFINNMETFLNDGGNNLFNDGLKLELLTDDFYKEFSFAVTIGMKLCFSKAMSGCIARQHGVSINLFGDSQIYESRSMSVEFPVSKIGLSSAGYVHIDFLSNYLDVINQAISLNVGVFLNVPGSDTISQFMDLWGSHSQRLDNIPVIGDTAGIGVDFVDGVIEDNPLIVDILTGGLNARLAIIYTFTDNDHINCNGFRIALSTGDVDTSLGGGVFFGFEYRQNGVGNIKQSIDWIDDVNGEFIGVFQQFGNMIIDLSKELINIIDDAMGAVGDEIAEIGEDIIDETKYIFISALNEVLDGIEDLANLGVTAANGAITGINTAINGANQAANTVINAANTVFSNAVSGVNTVINTVNSGIRTVNSKIGTVNSKVNTVKNSFSSANSAINTAKNDCKDVDNNCIDLGVTDVCVNDIINIDSICNVIFGSAVTSPMSTLSNKINAIPQVPTVDEIDTISSSVAIPNVPGFTSIDSVQDVSIAEIPNNAQQVESKLVESKLADYIDEENMVENIMDKIEKNEKSKPKMTVEFKIPIIVPIIAFIYTIIMLIFGYGLRRIQRWRKTGKMKKNKVVNYLDETDIDYNNK